MRKGELDTAAIIQELIHLPLPEVPLGLYDRSYDSVGGYRQSVRPAEGPDLKFDWIALHRLPRQNAIDGLQFIFGEFRVLESGDDFIDLGRAARSD
jgi:hypothetical protein